MQGVESVELRRFRAEKVESARCKGFGDLGFSMKKEGEHFDVSALCVHEVTRSLYPDPRTFNPCRICVIPAVRTINMLEETFSDARN